MGNVRLADLSPKVRGQVRAAASRGVGSDLEAELLGLLRFCGLPKPETQVVFAPPRQWRADMVWRDAALMVEVDGGTWSEGRHVRGGGYEEDCRKLAAAVLAGWRVVRFTRAMVEDGTAVNVIRELLQGGAR